MNDGYSFINCAKRLGAVLIGRVEPSVEIVSAVASEIVEQVGRAVDHPLRAAYAEVVREPVPTRFTELLKQLPEDYAASNGAGRASH
jgi:hypothetical protein